MPSHNIVVIFILQILSNNLFAQAVTENYILQKTNLSKIEIRTKKDTIIYLTTHQATEKQPKPTIIFLQGSLPVPALLQYDDTSTVSIIPFDMKPYRKEFNFVIIARKGIPLIGNYSRDASGYTDNLGKVPFIYEKHNNASYRTQQAKTVLNYLCRQSWVKKEAIFVIGHSEGYRIAAKLAAIAGKKIAKLVCMSADPFNRTAEEIVRSRIECVQNNNDSFLQAGIDISISNFKNIEGNIEQYKDDIELYNWMSYNSELAFESLQKFKKPILVTYGTDDITAFHNDLLPFLLRKNKLTMMTYPNLGHHYNKFVTNKDGKDKTEVYLWDDVMRDIIKWLLLK